MTLDQVLTRLRAACDEEETVAAWARKHKLSRAYVGAVLNGRYKPHRRLLAALGLRAVVTRTVTYEEVEP